MNLNIRIGKYRHKLVDDVIDGTYYDDDDLAPVMPAIDAVQQLIEEESKSKRKSNSTSSDSTRSKDEYNEPIPGTSKQAVVRQPERSIHDTNNIKNSTPKKEVKRQVHLNPPPRTPQDKNITVASRVRDLSSSMNKVDSPNRSNHNNLNDDEESFLVRNNPLNILNIPFSQQQRQDEYELIPKSVTLDVYSNDPEVKRFLKQLPKIPNESGLNEQDYKCYSCRRPIGLVFGQSRLCQFDGHNYCSECHLNDKSVIPSKILCNWDFNKYPVSKRNQHFLTLISNESMFELRKISPLLYKISPELKEIEELRRQAFFVRSYCTTCAQESISFELTKLIWPREHLIKQTDTYSLEDLVQVRNGALKQTLKNVISFGRQHVLSCVLCCQKGFICELCKSSQIIYPFDTESVHRCNDCQSTYHKLCFDTKPDSEACPRCQRLEARRQDT